MTDATQLSRRERQIMDIVYRLGEATVSQVQDRLENPPTTMAIRRTMHILCEKGHLRGHPTGRTVTYKPRAPKRRAGVKALEGVLRTFFGGSLEDALAAHLVKNKRALTDEEKERLKSLIDNAGLETDA